IVHALTKLESVRVLAWDGNERPTAALTVAGSLQSVSDTDRVTIQLIDGATGSYYWSDVLDRRMESGFRLQEAIAQTIVDKSRSGFVEGSQRTRLTEN